MRAHAAALLLLACGEANAPAAAQRSEPATLETLSEVGAEALSGVLRGRSERVLLVNLWSTWCQPCMEEMPALLALDQRYRDRGLGTVLISMDIASARPAALSFLQELGAPSPAYVRSGRDADFIPAVHADWSGTLPATLLLDAERRPLGFWTGEAPLAELEAAIQRALSPP
ncbi:MAG: TlpA disulfide reductase family protein [Myxococcota bacterium]